MKNLKQSIVCSLIIVAAFVAKGDVVLPNTSTIADIQDAIDSAQPGDVITLADGTYAFNQTLYVTNGVTLAGSGRDMCILAGDDSTSLETALVIDHTDACVKNLTIANITTTTAFNFTGVGARIKSGLLMQARVTGCKSLASHNRTAGVTLEGSNAVMTHCLVDHNEGTGGNNLGGVRIMGGGGTMANCLVWANTGVNAGGVSLKPDPWKSVKVVNCTIVGNTATTRGGGLADEPDYTWSANVFYGPVVVNTIIADNTAPSGADVYFSFSDEAGQNASLFNCLCPTLACGTNTQTGDPVFVSEASGNFRLKRGSPGRSAGDADKAASVLGYSLVGTLDFYGQPRVKFVSRKGVADIDIGATESKYSPSGFRISFR